MSSGAIGASSLAAAIIAIALLPLAGGWRPPRLAHPDRDALRDSGIRVSLHRLEAIRAAAGLLGGLLGVAVGLPAAGVVLSLLAPSVALRVRAGTARGRARTALAPLLAAAHASLRSGLALPESLRRAVAACDDPIARRPFAAALARFDLGDPLDAALAIGARGSADPRLRDALETLALGVSERMPVDRAASLLDAVATLVRHDDGVESDIRARTAGLRVQLHLLAAVVPLLSLYLFFTMPGLATTLESPLGRTVLLPAAAILELAGLVVSRRIVASVLA